MEKQELNYLNETRRAHQWKMAFFGLLFLIVGIVIGAGVGVLVIGRPLPAPNRPDQYIERITRRMESELSLSDPQAQQLRRIVSEHLEALDQIRQETRPRIEEELATMNQRIQAILDPPQQQVWQEMTRRLNNRLDLPGDQRPRGPYGPGPRGPGFNRQEGEGMGPGPYQRRQGMGMHRMEPPPAEGPPPQPGDPNRQPPR